ncbi:unnamed protein product, partial [Adineta ricciae]
MLTYVSQSNNNTIIISSQKNVTIWGLLINLTAIPLSIPYNVKLQIFVRDCTNNQDWLPDWINTNDSELITTEATTSFFSSLLDSSV